MRTSNALPGSRTGVSCMWKKIIDVSAFCGVWPKWHVPNDLAVLGPSYLDRYGIDKAVVSSLQAVFYDCDAANEEVLELASQEPRFIPTCSVTPQMDDRCLRVLDEYASAGARAVRLYPQHHGYDLDVEPLVGDICERAAELKMPVWLPVRVIMDWSLPVLDVKAITRKAARFPATDFIVSGVNYGEFRPMLAGMAKSKNLYLELSGFQMLGGIERLVKDVGADKLLFGTGLPLQYPLCNTLKVGAADISADEQERIHHLNAERLLRL